MAVFVLLVEEPHRQLGEQKSCPLEHREHGTQPCSPSCALGSPIQGSPGLSETPLENADGAVVLPCGQPCLGAGGYPPLKLPACSPAGLLCLPSRTIWMVNREERLWEPGGVSLAPKPVAFSSDRAPAIILSSFVPSVK